MDDAGIPKLTDFGVSRAAIYSSPLNTTSYFRPKGTLPWMAYELLAFFDCDQEISPLIEFKCTKASDMWAFGMVIYVRRPFQSPDVRTP